MWTVDYAPKDSSDIVGQPIDKVKDFIINFSKQKNKALLIYGPIGSGKTASAYALEKELNLEIMELNASDLRNSDQIINRIGSSMQQMSLFMKRKLIIIDEIDGIAGREDRGGIAAMTKLIPKTAHPIIIIANNPFDRKFKSLKKLCTSVEYKALSTKDIVQILQRITDRANLSFSKTELTSIARRSGGDARASILDLQLTASDKQLLLDEMGLRSQEESMPQALLKVLKMSDPLVARQAFWNVKEDIDQQFLWVDENMPKEYTKPQDLARAYHYLSLADIFRGRIRRRQHWDFLVYVGSFLTAGIAVSKDAKYPGFTPYKPTMRLLRIWQTNMKNNMRKSIAQKIAHATHCSARDAFETVSHYAYMIKTTPEITEELEFTDDELKYLNKIAV